MRYLRSRRREGFISVIAMVLAARESALGVATLIIVMAVMNGFRRGAPVEPHSRSSTATSASMAQEKRHERLRHPWPTRCAKSPASSRVTPIIEGQVMATAQRASRSGAVVRGALKPADIMSGRAIIADNIRAGLPRRLRRQVMLDAGRRPVMAGKPGPHGHGRVRLTLISAQGQRHRVRYRAPAPAPTASPATFEIGMFEYDSRFRLTCRWPAAQLYFRMPGCGV